MTAPSSAARPTFVRSRCRIVASIATAIVVAAILTPSSPSARAADTPQRSEGEFLTGWYDAMSAPARLPAMRGEGMNSVMPYHDSSADVPAYLDAARDAGVKVLVEIDRAIVRAGDADAITRFVAQFKTHPSVSGWYLADEPSINITLGPLSVATAEALYEAVKAEDPAHPVFIAFSSSSSDDMNAYRNAYDVAMWDDYPARLGEAEFTGMDVWKYRLQQRAVAATGKQGFVPIIQAFTTGQTGPTRYYRLPTAAEARYMTYSAVQTGATGIFYWTRYRSTFSFIDDVIKPLTSELNRLGPALTGGAIAGVASVALGGPSVVARTYRDPSTGGYSVVVVNHSAQQVDATLSISTSLGLVSAHSADGAVTRIEDGMLGTPLQPYEARTYDLSSAPTIGDVPTQNLDEDTPTTVAVTVGDDRTDPASLVLTAQSSDQTLLPDTNVVVGGSGTDRTLTIAPAEDLSGTATVRLTLTDGDDTAATDTFDVVVTPVNDPPTISAIAPQTTSEGTATATIGFTVGDVESSATALTVSGSSSNTALVSNSKIVFGGTGASRTVKITPNAGYSGHVTISVTVKDPSGSAATSAFKLTVASASGATFGVSNASIVEGHRGTRYMAFTITRWGAYGKTSRIDFRTSNGTASSSSDYSSVQGSAMLGNGGTKTVLVPIKGDRTFEANETLVLTLSRPTYASITDGSGTGMIVNDD